MPADAPLAELTALTEIKSPAEKLTVLTVSEKVPVALEAGTLATIEVSKPFLRRASSAI